MFSIRKPSQHTSMRQSLRRDAAMRLTLAMFAALLLAQGAFWNHTRAIKPEMSIVADVPGETTVKALSFGDEEAFFRLLALNIQMSGDTFGRFTALYKYDFNKLYHWFRLLDTLNNQSNFLPSLASYYFSQTQNSSDVRYLVDYLEEYTAGRAKEKWWWVTQAAYLSSHKLKDLNRALTIASTLRGVRDIPIWAQQLPAFLHEQRGEFGEAAAIIEAVMKHPEDYTQGELNFMRYFVEERLHRLDTLQAEFDRAQQEKDAAKAKGIAEPVPMGPPSDVGAMSLGEK
jgi:hypothetical protein